MVRKNINSLNDAAREYGDHEGVNKSSIEAWASQFRKHPGLALNILKNIDYYSAEDLRKLLDKLVDNVRNRSDINSIRKTLFIPIGNVYEGSPFIISRALQDTPGINKNQIENQLVLTNEKKMRKYDGVVLLDIFSGTGEQLSDWWKNTETLLLPLISESKTIILGLLLVNGVSFDKLKEIKLPRICVRHLDKDKNVLSGISKSFTAEEKEFIRKYCKYTSCDREYLYGWGSNGLLVVFKHGCPNNSLPILWYDSKKWKKLFRRRAI